MTAPPEFFLEFDDGRVEARDPNDLAALPEGVVDWWIVVPKEAVADLRDSEEATTT